MVFLELHIHTQNNELAILSRKNKFKNWKIPKTDTI